MESETVKRGKLERVKRNEKIVKKKKKPLMLFTERGEAEEESGFLRKREGA